MSGLSSTPPHYVFAHNLNEDGFDYWILNGLSNKANDEQECLLPILLAFAQSRDTIWSVLELEQIQLNLTMPTNLEFYGELTYPIMGRPMQLRCAGFISIIGRGVLWVREADERL